MSEAPKRIWACNTGGWGRVWLEGPLSGFYAEALVGEYILATEHARLMSEKDAKITAAVKAARLAALERAAKVDQASEFNRADWFWRTMDPDDCGDSPEEAINRGMVGLFCVCEVASSYAGPTRYGFIAPVFDPESDDEEFVHFATQQEAIDAAKHRAEAAAIRALAEKE